MKVGLTRFLSVHGWRIPQYTHELEAAAAEPGYAQRSMDAADVEARQAAMVERAMDKAGLRRAEPGPPEPLADAMQSTRIATAAMTGPKEWRKP